MNPYQEELKRLTLEKNILTKQLTHAKTMAKRLSFVKVANDKMQCTSCKTKWDRKIKCMSCGKIGMRREKPGYCSCGTYIKEIFCPCGATKDLELPKRITAQIKYVDSQINLKKKIVKQAEKQAKDFAKAQIKAKKAQMKLMKKR